MGKRSRDKGKRGEREAAAKWQELFGIPIRRSQQYCGTGADDLTGQPGVSIEVKRRQQLSIPQTVQQAVDEAAEGDIAVVLHRADRQPWLISLRLDDLPELVVRLFHTLANRHL